VKKGLILAALAAAVVSVLAAAPAPAATSAMPARTSLHVVTLNGFQIGGRRFLGRTPIHVTSAFGKPSSRFATRTAMELRYGTWTIHFKKRRSDGKFIADAARSYDQALFGSRGRRLLAPSWSRAAIERAVTAEVDYTPDGNFNDWMPRNGTFVGLDFPRTISWGIDARGRRWLRFGTDIELEFRR
jgi:hypothetical protein